MLYMEIVRGQIHAVLNRFYWLVMRYSFLWNSSFFFLLQLFLFECKFASVYFVHNFDIPKYSGTIYPTCSFELKSKFSQIYYSEQADFTVNYNCKINTRVLWRVDLFTKYGSNSSSAHSQEWYELLAVQ